MVFLTPVHKECKQLLEQRHNEPQRAVAVSRLLVPVRSEFFQRDSTSQQNYHEKKTLPNTILSSAHHHCCRLKTKEVLPFLAARHNQY